MADMYFSGSTTNSIDAYIIVDTARNGLQFDWFANGGYYGTSFGNDASTTYYFTYGGLSSGTVYSLSAKIYDNGSLVTTVYTTGTTQSPPSPPGSVSGLSAYNVTTNSISISWNSASGATGYNIYLNGHWQTGVSGNSYTFGSLNQYTTYSFTVEPYNTSGVGGSQSGSATTRDGSPPIITNFYASNIARNSITMYASGFDAHSGLSGFNFYCYLNDGTTLVGSQVQYQSNNQAFATFSGLQPDTNYIFQVIPFDAQLNYGSTTTVTVKTLKNRPENFTWDTSKTSGGNFNISASEWNRLTTTINLFRTYKLIANYSFTAASSGAVFQAFYYNQAVTAINEMNPPSPVPSSRNVGDIIYASDIDQLRTSLNSIA